jgi:GNAT superfamily N-acetyltransferase
MVPAVTLRPMPGTEVELLLAGRRPGTADKRRGSTLAWHVQYPLTDTLVAVRMLIEAHQVAGDATGDWLTGRARGESPRWWIHQVVVDGCVVGDIGFHGPPAPDASAVVEIGYAVVPALRRRGIAGQACRLLVEQAWRDGAEAVVAETEPDNLASQRVLHAAGFSPWPGGGFGLKRPAPR